MTEHERVIVEKLKSGFFALSSEGRILRTGTLTRTGRVKSVKLAPADHMKTDGYMQIRLGRSVSALSHRVIWLFVVGEIPDGFEINHKNGIRHDNRLANLELATPGQNLQHAYDQLNRTRVAGERNGRHKLTVAQSKDIKTRAARGESQRSLAREFNVSHTVVQRIVKGRLWRDGMPEASK